MSRRRRGSEDALPAARRYSTLDGEIGNLDISADRPEQIVLGGAPQSGHNTSMNPEAVYFPKAQIYQFATLTPLACELKVVVST